MMSKLKAVHYLNQFFGGIGGEDKAGMPPTARDGAVGPGILFQQILGEEAEIVGTVMCGDNTFAENMDRTKDAVLSLIKKYEPDLVLAGPAFNAGRYGIACAAVCKAVTLEMGIPAVTAMFPENPAVEMYKKWVYIIPADRTTLGMKDAAQKMAQLVLKPVRGETLGTPEEEGYIPRGVRRNYFASENGAVRAVEMLVRKMKAEPFRTEYPMPVFDRVAPLPPVERFDKATIALITSGGIVPKGNPDRIESSSASRFGKYDIREVGLLSPETYETAHGGYDPTYANADPHRVLPLDVVRDLEREGRIGKLYPYYYATVGNGTSVAHAKDFAQEISKDLVRDGVQAVILTST
jgi:glycine reductase